jgi:hypothetical protein
VTSSSSLTALQLWLLEAAARAGVERPSEPDPLGLELEFDGYLARVLPHSEERRAVLEIEVRSLAAVNESDLAKLALQMLRLNHDARFEHDWVVILDDEDMLCVSTTIELGLTPPESLGDRLSDGLARARILVTLSDELMGLVNETPASAPGAFPGAQNAIRG